MCWSRAAVQAATVLSMAILLEVGEEEQAASRLGTFN
jgi:hypothetical protein